MIHLQSQPHLSPRQRRWQEFLQEFNFIIEYQEGKHNAVADGLSRRPDHKSSDVMTIAAVEVDTVNSTIDVGSDLKKDIIAAYQTDSLCVTILTKLNQPSVTDSEWKLIDGLILNPAGRVRIPDSPSIKLRILQECHDVPLGGHVGSQKTIANVTRRFVWPKLT